jgi:bifunctional non-homologous end joining protein LigD
MLAAVRQQDLEGVVAKRLDSPYQPGVRSRDWRKILAKQRLLAVIGGFIPVAAGVGGLLAGESDPATGVLRFLGRVDHGFTPRTRRGLAEMLVPLEAAQSPFAGPVGWGAGWGRPSGPPPRWVHPVVEVAVEHIGRDPASGRLRHPAFAGLPSQS